MDASCSSSPQPTPPLPARPPARPPPQEHAAGAASLWVLKEDVHRGKGVGVATPARALLHALDRAPGGGAQPKHVLAQRFLGEQYLVGGRPFYIRCAGGRAGVVRG